MWPSWLKTFYASPSRLAHFATEPAGEVVFVLRSQELPVIFAKMVSVAEGSASPAQPAGGAAAAQPTAADPAVEQVTDIPAAALKFLDCADRVKVPHPLAIAALTALETTEDEDLVVLSKIPKDLLADVIKTVIKPEGCGVISALSVWASHHAVR